MPAFEELEPATTDTNDELSQDDTTTDDAPESIPTEDEGAEASAEPDESEGIELAPDAPPQPKEYVREGRRFVPKAVPEKADGTPPAPAAPPPSPVVPWKANVYGNETELIPGAKFHPDHGLLIPKDQMGYAQMLMARGTKYDEVKQQRQAWAQEKATLTESAKFENERLADVLQRTAMNPEWVMLAATDPDAATREMQFLLRDAQLTLKEKYGKSAWANPTPADAPNDPGELDPYDAEMGVRGFLADVLNTPDYHGLFTDAEKDALTARLMAIEPFAKHEGQWALDTLVARQLIDALAEAPRREKSLREQMAQSTKAQAASRRNAAAVPKPTGQPKAAKATTPKGNDFPADKPWLDKSKSMEERKHLYAKHMTGLSYA